MNSSWLDEGAEPIRMLARAFVEEELWPHEEKVDSDDEMPSHLLAAIRKKAVATGLYAFNMPADAGGPGLSNSQQVSIREELGRTTIAMAEGVGRPPLALTYCTDAQRVRYALPAARAEKWVTFALTEPDAGSDIGNMRTRATRDGSGWRINGTKHFISHGNTADVVIVFAVTEPAAVTVADRYTAFLVDSGTTGFTVGHTFAKMGWRGYDLAELVFNECWVDEESRLGDVGGGLGVALTSIGQARLGVAAHCCGLGTRCIELATAYMGSRRQFGRSLAEFQGLRWMLADAATELTAARALTYAAADRLDAADGSSRMMVSMAKLFASEVAGRVVDVCLQLFGGSGYMHESPIERLYRDARAFRIGEGTSEIHRNTIARALLGREASS